MEIKKQNDNTLFNRKEVEVVLPSDSNPSMAEAKKALADEFKADEGLIVVNKIHGQFGTNEFIISAEIYKTKEDMEKVEGKAPEEEKKEEATPAAEAAPASETPAEEAKEEVKEEPKEE